MQGNHYRGGKGGGAVRSEFEVDRAVDRHSDMIRRICLYHLKNASDTEDVFQTVFLKYLLYEGSFEGPEHEKAWFIRVTLNACFLQHGPPSRQERIDRIFLFAQNLSNLPGRVALVIMQVNGVLVLCRQGQYRIQHLCLLGRDRCRLLRQLLQGQGAVLWSLR